MTEAEFLREARLFLGQQKDVVIWRNESVALPNIRHEELKRLVALLKSGHLPGALALAEAWLKKGLTATGLVRGASDLIGMLKPNGRLLAFELKVKNGRPTEEQSLFVKLINDMGGHGDVVYSMRELELSIEAARRGAPWRNYG